MTALRGGGWRSASSGNSVCTAMGTAYREGAADGWCFFLSTQWWHSQEQKTAWEEMVIEYEGDTEWHRIWLAFSQSHWELAEPPLTERHKVGIFLCCAWETLLIFSREEIFTYLRPCPAHSSQRNEREEKAVAFCWIMDIWLFQVQT